MAAARVLVTYLNFVAQKTLILSNSVLAAKLIIWSILESIIDAHTLKIHVISLAKCPFLVFWSEEKNRGSWKQTYRWLWPGALVGIRAFQAFNVHPCLRDIGLRWITKVQVITNCPETLLSIEVLMFGDLKMCFVDLVFSIFGPMFVHQIMSKLHWCCFIHL